MRLSVVFANSPPRETEQLRDRLRGPWRQGLRAVMVLLSLHGLPAGEIAARRTAIRPRCGAGPAGSTARGPAGLADRPRLERLYGARYSPHDNPPSGSGAR
jgi:hypothetical protein